jgi:hypothetical protein
MAFPPTRCRFIQATASRHHRRLKIAELHLGEASALQQTVFLLRCLCKGTR